jgi:hypothetical protein
MVFLGVDNCRIGHGLVPQPPILTDLATSVNSAIPEG